MLINYYDKQFILSAHQSKGSSDQFVLPMIFRCDSTKSSKNCYQLAQWAGYFAVFRAFPLP